MFNLILTIIVSDHRISARILVLFRCENVRRLERYSVHQEAEKYRNELMTCTLYTLVV